MRFAKCVFAKCQDFDGREAPQLPRYDAAQKDKEVYTESA
jgi:hypothetical protein